MQPLDIHIEYEAHVGLDFDLSLEVEMILFSQVDIAIVNITCSTRRRWNTVGRMTEPRWKIQSKRTKLRIVSN